MVERPKIALITGNWSKDNRSIVGTFLKFVKILLPISINITVVSANHSIKSEDPKVYSKKINYKYFEKSLLKSIFYFLAYQINVALFIMKSSMLKKIDTFIFCFGADLFIVPIVLAKLFGKKVIIRTDGRSSIETKYFGRSMRITLFKILFYKMVEKINYLLADIIIPESECTIYFYKFEDYLHKISIGPLYVEDIFFKNNKKLDDRDLLIGYVGNFSAVKGVLDFAESLTLLQKEGICIKTLFVGDGELRAEVEKVVHDHNIQATFVGWVGKEKMPVYLNNLKLLVLPSRKEGLPNIVLEAMACGTPVLATPVGGVPSVVKDGRTGFIMENNSPECIAENVTRALNHPDLEQIVGNASVLVEREYTYEVTVERWKRILDATYQHKS